MIYQYTIKTDQKIMFYNIDSSLHEAVTKSDVQNGIAIIFAPHTTAGITINENGDPDVLEDLSNAAKTYFPNLSSFKHFEGNSTAHFNSTVTGASETIIIDKGSPVLGRWQSVYFAEFDGPRTRHYYIKILEG